MSQTSPGGKNASDGTDKETTGASVDSSSIPILSKNDRQLKTVSVAELHIASETLLFQCIHGWALPRVVRPRSHLIGVCLIAYIGYIVPQSDNLNDFLLECTKMLRWNKVIVFAAMLTLSVPFAAYGDKLEIKDGCFIFVHAPAAPIGECEDPPGLLFSVESESFAGKLVTKKKTIGFEGMGKADGCAFFEPIDGVVAAFTGSFAWQTAHGELRGTFELLDFPTDIEGVFAAVVFITFDGGTGKFKKAKGKAIAEGFDLPFGGIGGDQLVAGVVATSVKGKLKLKE